MEAIKRFISQNGIIAWVIILVVGMFVVSLLTLAIFKSPGYNVLFEALAMPITFGEFFSQPWSLFTYWINIPPVLFFSIAFNLLFLWQFGRIFKMFLGEIRLRNLMVFSAFVTPLLILLIGAAIQGATESNPLLGKSPQIFGLGTIVISLIAATITFRPNFPVNLFLFGRVAIVWVGLFIILIGLVMFRGRYTVAGLTVIVSAGMGFAYGKLIQNGSDFTSWIGTILDGKEKQAGKPKNASGRKTRMKVVKKDGPIDEDEVNRILDKINKVGYEKLSRAEKETLAKYSEGK